MGEFRPKITNLNPQIIMSSAIHSSKSPNTYLIQMRSDFNTFQFKSLQAYVSSHELKISFTLINLFPKIDFVKVFTCISFDGFLFYKIFPANTRLDAKMYHDQILVPLVKKLRNEGRIESSIFMQDGKCLYLYLYTIYKYL